MVRETSKEVYRRIKEEGLLSKRRLQVYEVLYEHGPLTAGEIWALHLKQQKVQLNSVSPRTSELLAVGAIKEVCVRPCSHTGNNSIAWDVTASVPRKFKPNKERLTRRQLTEGLKTAWQALNNIMEIDTAPAYSAKKMRTVASEALNKLVESP